MPRDDFREVGATGLKSSRGVITEEFQPSLKGEKAIKVYREMGDNDPVIGAILFAIQMLLRSVEWAVVPFGTDANDELNAEFVEGCMHDMSHTWNAHIAEALSFVQYGWSYSEIVYKRREGNKAGSGASSNYSDGRIGWRKFAPRSQDSLSRWELSPDGGIEGLWQKGGISDSTPNNGEVFIPIEKSCLYRAAHWKNNPEGRSVLRTAYRSWHYKRRIEEAEAIGIDRDLTGVPKIGVPPELLASASGEGAAALAEWERIGKNLRSDEQAYVLMPNVYDEQSNPLYTLELMGTNARRLIPTGEVIDRHARGIALSCLADVILLGHESVGSFALSRTKDEMFTASLQAFADEIAAVDRQYAVARLFALNGLPLDRLPYIRPGRLAKVDLGVVGDFISKIGNAGFMEPDLESENQLREYAGLPARFDDGGLDDSGLDDASE